MNPELTITQASAAELAEVVALLKEARAWLLARGIRQWKTPYPVEWIADEIARGEVYLAKVDGELAGSLTLNWSDDLVWPDAPQNAGYVHRLVISRKFAGQGIGQQLLHWTEDASRQQGKQFLRLDCWAENPRLCDYYTAAGFTSLGVVEIKISDKMTYLSHRFERRVMKEQLPLKEITIMQAQPGDEVIAADIACEAHEWLVSRGMPLWSQEAIDLALFRERLEAGELYLAKVAGEPVGTMFMQWDDPLCWPDKLGSGDSVYIHRLAVRRSFAGRGIPQACFEFAKVAALQASRKYLRLDTVADRRRLRAVYEQAGFLLHSCIEVHLKIGDYSIARYEIEL